MERKPKTIFQLDTPYTEISWPQIDHSNQQTILDLLVRLLSPIGHHRSSQAVPSKGKRNKKRKRKSDKTKDDDKTQGTVNSVPPLPTPELSPHLLIGLQSITRHLECVSRRTCPENSQTQAESDPAAPCPPKGILVSDDRHLAAIFVSRSSQPSILYAHLPQLIAVASLANPNLSPTRLVQLPKGCEDTLCASLGLPRAGFVAIMDGAAHSRPLLDFVQKHVAVIDVPWLKEVQTVQYQALKVNLIETTTPVLQKK